MRIVLPKGYRHVGLLGPDQGYEDVHIVEEHRGSSPREGYTATTLCGIDIDTRSPGVGADGLKRVPEWGTLHESERGQSDRSGIWAHTCSECSRQIRTAPVIAERFAEAWNELSDEGMLHLDEQVTPFIVAPGAVPDLIVAVVERLLLEGTIQ